MSSIRYCSRDKIQDLGAVMSPVLHCELGMIYYEILALNYSYPFLYTIKVTGSRAIQFPRQLVTRREQLALGRVYKHSNDWKEF